MKNILLSAGKKIRQIAKAGQHRYRKLLGKTPVEADRESTKGLQAGNHAGVDRSVGKNEEKRMPTGEPHRKYRAPAAKKSKPAWTLDNFQVTPEEGKSRFHDFEIPLPVMRAIADQKFKYCTAIQEKTLADVLAGDDLVGKANTGTGKTAVFLIAILARLLEEKRSGKAKKGVRALVLAPTRELVVQIAKDGVGLAKYCNLSVRAVYGGVDYQKQMDILKHRKADIVIATPGRLIDFMNKGVVNLGSCGILVLDEADRMLDMGFIPDVRRIVGRLPGRDNRQTMLFSATVPGDVQRLASQWCRNPKVVEAEPEQMAVDTVEQIVYLATAQEKYSVLYNLIQLHPDDRIVVFANMKNETKRLANRLQRNGIDCVLLSGDVDQNKRTKRLESFRQGKVKILVATDVAGRGIHIDGITFVVNYTLPYEPEDYVHRIGRTGRAGASGKAVSFACDEGAFYLPAIEELLGKKFDCILPEESLIVLPPKGLDRSPQEAESGKRPAKTRNRNYKSRYKGAKKPAGK